MLQLTVGQDRALTDEADGDGGEDDQDGVGDDGGHDVFLSVAPRSVRGCSQLAKPFWRASVNNPYTSDKRGCSYSVYSDEIL